MAKETKFNFKSIKKNDVKTMLDVMKNNIKISADEILVFECLGGNLFFGKLSGKFTIYEEMKK